MTKHFAVVIVLFISSLTSPALADDVNGAAKAFSQAQQAMAANNPAGAAEMYELADELAPSAPALRNAARARLAAGHIATAATLAAQLLQRYSNDKESRSVAEAILSDLAPRLTQLAITCSEECTLALDGKAASTTKPRTNHVLYVLPGTRTIVATFSDEREAKTQLTAVAGNSKQIQLDAPAKKVEPVTVPTTAPTTTATPPLVTTTVQGPVASRGIGRKWFAIAAVATAGLGAAATLRGFATLDTRDAIEDATAMGDTARAQSLYDKGKSQQLQTNILFGATAAVGVSAIVLAVLADWSPHSETQAVSVSPTTGGATVVFGGSF